MGLVSGKDYASASVPANLSSWKSEDVYSQRIKKAQVTKLLPEPKRE